MGEAKRRRQAQPDNAQRAFTDDEAQAVLRIQAELDKALYGITDEKLPAKIVAAIHGVLTEHGIKGRFERAALTIAAAASASRYELSRVGLLSAPSATLRDDAYDLRASAAIGFFYECIGNAAAVQRDIESGDPNYDITMGATEGRG